MTNEKEFIQAVSRCAARHGINTSCAVLQYMLQEAGSTGKREKVYEYAYRQERPVQIVARFKDGE